MREGFFCFVTDFRRFRLTWHSAGECGIFSSNNVFFTLLFGLLVIWGVEGIKQKFVEDVYGNKAAAIRVILTYCDSCGRGISGTSFFVRIMICREL